MPKSPKIPPFPAHHLPGRKIWSRWVSFEAGKRVSLGCILSSSLEVVFFFFFFFFLYAGVNGGQMVFVQNGGGEFPAAVGGCGT